MRTTLPPRGRPGKALRELAEAGLRRVERCIATARDHPREAPEAIHRARVTLKRLRACLRLASAATAQKSPAIRRLRDLSATLSASRDLDVAHATLAALLPGRARSPKLLPPRPPPPPSRVAPALAAAREALAATAFPGLRRRDLRGASRRLARKALRAARRAEADPGPVPLHTLRKRAKTLLYAAEWIGPLAGRKLRRHLRDLRELAEKLGRHQDLQVLLALLPPRSRAAEPIRRRAFHAALSIRADALAHAWAILPDLA
jgi:CHAD domain-containing protein